MRAIGGLDHVIVLVRDLEAAAAAWGRLGFRTTPEALHSSAMGTANATIVFEDGTYVELLTVRDETPLSAGFVAHLREREGPFGIAFKTDDARAAADLFDAAGAAWGGAVDFARPVELPEGTQEAAFTIARLQPRATPGGSMFVCQHHTPEVVWRPDYLAQPNAVTGLAEVIGVAADLEPLRAAYGGLFEHRLVDHGEGLLIRTTTGVIRFLTPLAYAGRFGRMARTGEAHLAALVFRVGDRARCWCALQGSGRTVVRSERDTLQVPPDAASGTMLEFVPPEAP